MTTLHPRLFRHLGRAGALGVIATLAACGASTASDTPAPTASVPTCATGTITVSGSTALQPLAAKAAQAYEAACPGATINVSGGGSSKGLADVASGASDIGDSDVPASNAKSIDPSLLTDHQVAIVVFAVVTSPDVHVSNLTAQQVRDIFSGKDTNWSQVGGPSEPITLIERKTGSGTRLAFDKDMMNGTPESTSPARTEDSTQLVVGDVAGGHGAVSYINVASAGTTVSVVSIDGVTPGHDGVAAGTYPLYSHEHMYTRRSAPVLAQSFIQFVDGSGFKSTLTSVGFLATSVTSSESAADR